MWVNKLEKRTNDWALEQRLRKWEEINKGDWKKATTEVGRKSGKCNAFEAKKKKKSVSRRRDQLSPMFQRGQVRWEQKIVRCILKTGRYGYRGKGCFGGTKPDWSGFKRDWKQWGVLLYRVTEKNNICREIWIQERKFGFLGCFLGGEKLHVFANRNYIVEKTKSWCSMGKKKSYWNSDRE